MPDNHHAAQDGFNPVDVPAECIKRQTPLLDDLFNQLEAGMLPNCIELMGAISDLVAFHTKGEQESDGADCPTGNMSQNKCRFCS